MTKLIEHGRCPASYKEAQDLYERAVEILKYKRGGEILKSEAAALYYGFHVLKDAGGLGAVWEAVGEAGKLAVNGYGVKQDSVRPCKAPLDEEPAGD